MKTAILLITFNRLDYVKETLKAISKAKPPRLYLASDGPRPNKPGEKEQVQAVRDYILTHIDWPCEIKTRFLKTNSGGCKYGVSGAVSWFFENEQEGIILEDDCVANPSFFSYCEKLLEKYRNDKRVWHIAGDAPVEANIKDSYYFAKIQHCWGWASWADRWKHFSLDISKYDPSELKKFSKHKTVQQYWGKILERLKRNEIDSWAYPWTFNVVAHDGLCINPAHNLISNIGEIGVHYSGKNNHLNKNTFSINKIKHPWRVLLNKKLVDRIYAEKFGISLKSTQQKVSKYYFFSIPLLKIEKENTFPIKKATTTTPPKTIILPPKKEPLITTKKEAETIIGKANNLINKEQNSVKKEIVQVAKKENIKSIQRESLPPHSHLSFAQDGEDLCLYSYINKNPNYKGFYVDIGALDPFRFSNTYIFYQHGWHGINIDGTPGSMSKFNKFRPNDLNIEAVVSDKSGEEINYFIFNDPALNCFDKIRIKEIEANTQYKLLKEKKLKTKTINEILEQYLPKGQKIDFITIDVEGIDTKIIRSLNYEKYAPDYFIIEELDYKLKDFMTYKSSSIYQFLSQKGYIVIAKTKRSVLYYRKES